MLDPISLEFRNDYGASKLAEAAGNMAEGAAKRMVGQSGTEMLKLLNYAVNGSSQLLKNTVQSYHGADNIPFSVPILVSKEFTPGYSQILKDSLIMSNPSGFAGKVDTVQAPNNFSPYEDIDPKVAISSANTYDVLIGKSIRMDKLVCTSYSYSPSIQVREDGSPVYAKLTYSFKTGRVLDAKEVTGWFIDL
jgi:hypothetical protein